MPVSSNTIQMINNSEHFQSVYYVPRTVEHFVLIHWISQKPNKVVIGFMLIEKMRKQRHAEIQQPAWAHTANCWWSQVLTQVGQTPKPCLTSALFPLRGFITCFSLCFLFSAWDIINKKNCEIFKVYNKMIWYLHTFWKDSPYWVNQHTHHLAYLLLGRGGENHSLSKFQLHNTGLLSSDIIHLSLYLFTNLSLFSPLPSPWQSPFLVSMCLTFQKFHM